MSTALTHQARSMSTWGRLRFRIERPFWSVLVRGWLLLRAERTLRVFTPDRRLVMLVKHPPMQLCREVTVFADEARSAPLLLLKARTLATVDLTFDVVDCASGLPFGAVGLRGLRSLVHDRFIITAPSGEPIGTLEETGASVLRRILPLSRSRHRIVLHGQEVARMRQVRLLTKEFEIELSPGPADPRFLLACALLAHMAETRREDA